MTNKRPTDRRLTWLLRVIDLGRWLARGHVRRLETISQDVRYGWRSLSRNPLTALKQL